MRGSRRWMWLVAVAWMAWPQCAPAPLIFTPGEGWHFERAGGESNWRRGRAKDQIEVAQAAFDRKQYGTALKAARRLVTQWPFSDHAPQGQYLLGRCLEAQHQDERAFKAYQKLVEQYPKVDLFDEVLQRQKAIADRFLAGQSFRVLRWVPTLPSMDKTVQMYEQIIKNGPFTDVAAQAQIKIGEANEKKLGHDYAAAAQAYERAADRYSGQPVGADALYKAGLAYNKQARTADYDQSIAAQAIATFSDFATLHPDDPRVAESAKLATSLKTEQARGSYDIARYYERHHRPEAALIYYNEVLAKDPKSPYADAARKRIDEVKRQRSK